MSFVTRIKTLPRWTWYTAAGVSAGAVGIKLWRDRAAPPADAQPGDGTTTGDAQPGSIQPATTGASPPGVIVPPIITGSSEDAGTIAGALAGAVGGVVDDFTSLFGTVIGGNQELIGGVIAGQQNNIDSAISALAGAGPAPQPVQANPTPITIKLPSPSQPPKQGPQQTPKFKNKAAALDWLHKALSSASNHNVRNYIQNAITHVEHGYPTAAKAAIAKAVAAGADKDTRGKLQKAAANI